MQYGGIWSSPHDSTESNDKNSTNEILTQNGTNMNEKNEDIKKSLNKSQLLFVSTERLLEKGKFLKVKEIFFEWSKDSSIQAYPKIFQDDVHLILIFLWLIIFLSFSTVTCFLCVQSILGYLQWSTVSTIQIVREAPTKLPAITICDSNMFTSKSAQTLLETLALQKFNINISTMNSTQFNVYKENLTNYAKIVVNNPDFGDENRKLLGFSKINPLVIQRKINLQSIGVGDFYSYFTWYWHANYGNCYQFNAVPFDNKVLLYSTEEQIGEGDYFGMQLRYS